MEHILVVGAGIIGMLTARELLRAGKRVTLCDRQQTGRASSWAGGGIVSPLYPWRYLDSISRLARWSQATYPDLVAELAAATGIDPELEPSGLLIAAPDEQVMAHDWAQRLELALEIVPAAKARELEPQAARWPDEVIWMPGIAQVRNPRLVKALHADLLRRGVALRVDTPVQRLAVRDAQVLGIETTAGPIAADAVVLSAGAWSRTLWEDLPSPPDVQPVRGQMLLFAGRPGLVRRMVLENGRYLIPRRDGHLLFGSTLETVGFDDGTTAEARAELEALALARFPCLRDVPVARQWAGLRPGSPAGVPYIARHPEIPNLYINAGHYRNGIVLGPASARLCADLVLEREPVVDPAPYRLDAARG